MPPWSQIATQRVPVAVGEVLVGEVEAADVDDPDEHVAAVAMPPRLRGDAAQGRVSGAALPAPPTLGSGPRSVWPGST